MAKMFEDLNPQEQEVIMRWSAEMGVETESLVSSFNFLDESGESVWSSLRKAAEELANAQLGESQPTPHTAHHSQSRT